MRVAVDDVEPVVAEHVRATLSRLGAEPCAWDDPDVAAYVRTGGAGGGAPGPSVAPTVVPTDGPAVAGPHVAAAGWWGGLGTLVASACLAEAEAPREVHVAYGMPATGRAVAALPRSWRAGAWALVTGDATARRDGVVVPEEVAAGRRLAWFPAPVGPAHAVAVGGHEHLALPDVPTVRTWLAVRSLWAEALQAVGRLDPAGAVGGRVTRWAQRPSDGRRGTTSARWAVVVEVQEAAGTVVRGWANGTDPVHVTGAMLALGALRLAAGSVDASARTVLDLGAVVAQLDALADLGVLRWQLGRPTPARR